MCGIRCFSILLVGGVTLCISRGLTVPDVVRYRTVAQLVEFKIRKCINMCPPPLSRVSYIFISPRVLCAPMWCQISPGIFPNMRSTVGIGTDVVVVGGSFSVFVREHLDLGVILRSASV